MRGLLMPLRLVAMVAALSFVLVSCGSDDSSSSGGGGGAAKEAGGTTPTDASCGMKSGNHAQQGRFSTPARADD